MRILSNLFPKRPAVCLHIFYEDIALSLVSRLRKVPSDFTLFVTTPLNSFDGRLNKELSMMRRPVVTLRCENKGRDVEPFIHALRHPQFQEHPFFLKLHTKRGDTDTNSMWRDYCFDTLLDAANFKEAVKKFRENRRLAMAGPRYLYKRGHSLMYGNREAFTRFAGKNLGITTIPEFGFFAGTMFWASSDVFRPIIEAPQSDIHFKPEAGAVDGAPEHVFERMFGLLPSIMKRQICLMDVGGGYQIVDAPGPADRHTIAETFKDLKETGSHAIFTI